MRLSLLICLIAGVYSSCTPVLDGDTVKVGGYSLRSGEKGLKGDQGSRCVVHPGHGRIECGSNVYSIPRSEDGHVGRGCSVAKSNDECIELQCGSSPDTIEICNGRIGVDGVGCTMTEDAAHRIECGGNTLDLREYYRGEAGHPGRNAIFYTEGSSLWVEVDGDSLSRFLLNDDRRRSQGGTRGEDGKDGKDCSVAASGDGGAIITHWDDSGQATTTTISPGAVVLGPTGHGLFSQLYSEPCYDLMGHQPDDTTVSVAKLCTNQPLVIELYPPGFNIIDISSTEPANLNLHMQALYTPETPLVGGIVADHMTIKVPALKVANVRVKFYIHRNLFATNPDEWTLEVETWRGSTYATHQFTGRYFMHLFSLEYTLVDHRLVEDQTYEVRHLLHTPGLYIDPNTITVLPNTRIYVTYTDYVP